MLDGTNAAADNPRQLRAGGQGTPWRVDAAVRDRALETGSPGWSRMAQTRNRDIAHELAGAQATSPDHVSSPNGDLDAAIPSPTEHTAGLTGTAIVPAMVAGADYRVDSSSFRF